MAMNAIDAAMRIQRARDTRDNRDMFVYIVSVQRVHHTLHAA